MSDNAKIETEVKAGWLVLRLKQGEGIFIRGDIEIRVASIKTINEIQLAIRAPKEVNIRKVK